MRRVPNVSMDDVDVNLLANAMNDFSGADIKAVVIDAYLAAIQSYDEKDERPIVTMNEIKKAIEKQKSVVDERNMKARKSDSQNIMLKQRITLA
jgi:ATP-dependent 26S proteasome regulatory subunit